MELLLRFQYKKFKKKFQIILLAMDTLHLEIEHKEEQK